MVGWASNIYRDAIFRLRAASLPPRAQEHHSAKLRIWSGVISSRLRLGPKDDQLAVPLPIGEIAEFRIRKDRLLLRVPEANDKESEYIVIPMTPRTAAAGNRHGLSTDQAAGGLRGPRLKQC